MAPLFELKGIQKHVAANRYHEGYHWFFGRCL